MTSHASSIVLFCPARQGSSCHDDVTCSNVLFSPPRVVHAMMTSHVHLFCLVHPGLFMPWWRHMFICFAWPIQGFSYHDDVTCSFVLFSPSRVVHAMMTSHNHLFCLVHPGLFMPWWRHMFNCFVLSIQGCSCTPGSACRTDTWSKWTRTSSSARRVSRRNWERSSMRIPQNRLSIIHVNISIRNHGWYPTNTMDDIYPKPWMISIHHYIWMISIRNLMLFFILQQYLYIYIKWGPVHMIWTYGPGTLLIQHERFSIAHTVESRILSMFHPELYTPYPAKR